ncbi:hypothetical protein [Roseivirga seohaensis]|uniref:hypothetical protein n=1 Tax=Roseivirga seohaensis TaxID=1914963 RepID=UPI000B1E8E83|nr:hypothetical protein [Roseivirga seohaensis]
MKSPITGLPMRLSSEVRNLPFQNTIVQIDYQFYLCNTTGERFVTTTLDELNLQRLKQAR